MKEAMEWAQENGGVTGPNIRQGMYEMSAAHDGAWVPEGLEGVCLPSGWTADDHRGLMTARIYRGHVSGSTEGAEVQELVDAAHAPEIAVEIYAASLLAIDELTFEGQTYLKRLAGLLRLPPELVKAVHEEAEAGMTASGAHRAA